MKRKGAPHYTKNTPNKGFNFNMNNFYEDWDHDGVMNGIDCFPLDKKRQDSFIPGSTHAPMQMTISPGPKANVIPQTPLSNAISSFGQSVGNVLKNPADIAMSVAAGPLYTVGRATGVIPDPSSAVKTITSAASGAGLTIASAVGRTGLTTAAAKTFGLIKPSVPLLPPRSIAGPMMAPSKPVSITTSGKEFVPKPLTPAPMGGGRTVPRPTEISRNISIGREFTMVPKPLTPSSMGGILPVPRPMELPSQSFPKFTPSNPSDQIRTAQEGRAFAVAQIQKTNPNYVPPANPRPSSALKYDINSGTYSPVQ